MALNLGASRQSIREAIRKRDSGEAKTSIVEHLRYVEDMITEDLIQRAKTKEKLDCIGMME